MEWPEDFYEKFGIVGEMFVFLYEEISDLRYKSIDQISEFCEDNDMKPNNIMDIVNRALKEIRIEDKSYDPRTELGNFLTYLRENGFVYDQSMRLFREA